MVKKNTRVHRETLPADLAAALLNVPFEAEEASQPESHASVGLRLQAARAELDAAVQAANTVLNANPLMEIIAEHAARKVGRRGRPLVVVDPSGEVMLEIHYLASGEPAPKPVAPATPKKRKSSLPSIKEIRREAELLGIDTELFGKNKTKLLEAIEKAKVQPAPVLTPLTPTPAPPAPIPEPVVSPTPAPKMTKTAPSLTPPKQVRLDGQKLIPLDDDDDDDVASLFRDDEEPAPAPLKAEVAPSGFQDMGFTSKVERNPVTAPIAGATVDVPASPPSPKVRPPRRGTPSGTATVAPKLGGGRSLSAIGNSAEAEVDIDTILAKPAPPPPPDED
jgi:hypothetical protein